MVNQHTDGTIEFAFYRPGARTVRVAGDFNLWDPTRHELANACADGWSRCRTRLSPGEYRFKYVVDGREWETDFAAYGVEPDPAGDWNAILLVQDDAELMHPHVQIEAGLEMESAGSIDRSDAAPTDGEADAQHEAPARRAA